MAPVFNKIPAHSAENPRPFHEYDVKDQVPPHYNVVSGKKLCPFALPTTFPVGCTGNICHGATMEKYGEVLAGIERPVHEIVSEALEYTEEYYRENNLPQNEKEARIAEIVADIKRQGYYTHTYGELSFGMKTAWRNARKCIMRSQWNTIELIDRRDVDTSEEMLEACFHHLRTARNGGRIKPTVTVFPQKFPGKEGPRMWGIQMLRYAGYTMPDGKVIGDSMNIEITNRAIELGWEPKYGKWDILPLIACADGKEPVMREVPEDCKREVHITHPDYPWFAELGLRWCDHPPVTQFGLTVGGIDYTAVPFSGWFMSSEIASRDLADENRYNALPEIAKRMGLPMSNRALWRDRAVLELTQAVIYSWDKAKTTMVDHHSASDSFIPWYEKEIKTRGHCPSDWVWITPPISGGTTKVFHQEMYSYMVKPSILPLLEMPWMTYWRRKGWSGPPQQHARYAPEKQISTPDAYNITIAYGTETHTATQFAEQIRERLAESSFAVAGECVEMNDLDLTQVKGTLIIVTCSYGDGVAPSCANQFLDRLRDPDTTIRDPQNLKYAVFGLGNSVLYASTYQAFPKQVDEELKKLGCRRIVPFGRGDETKGTEIGFQKWARTFMIAVEVGTESIEVEGADNEWTEPTTLDKIHDLDQYQPMKLTACKALFDHEVQGEQRSTIHVELESTNGKLEYVEGDHYSILPPTNEKDVAEAKALLGVKGDEEFEEGVNADAWLFKYVDFHDPPSDELVAIVGCEKKRTALEVLRELKAAPSDISAALHALPLKTPRHFSAASAPETQGNSMHLTICKLKDGHVSMPLAEAPLGAIFQGLPQTSKFRAPTDPSTPLILVGTGTGIAPHRGILEKRLATSDKNGAVLGIFGYRTPEEYLYADEFQTKYASPKNEWLTAFSRSGDRKRVNSVILENAEKISNLVDQGAAILICGSHEMGRDVQIAFAQALEKGKGLAAGEGENIIAKLKKETRYTADTYQQAH